MTLTLITSLCRSQQSGVKFHRFTFDQGLSINFITCISQDKQGFIWVGTPDGLNKYDGYKFTVYKNNPNISSSISNNSINSIYEDGKGIMYIGNNGGLNVYDREKDQFIAYKNNPTDPKSVSSNLVSTILEDRRGILWVGTGDNGLNVFDRKTKKFTRYLHDDNNLNSLRNNIVRTLAEDKYGNLWIGTASGISVLSADRKTFRHYIHGDDNPHSIINNSIHKIFVDHEGKVWVGSAAGGLCYFEEENQRFVTYLHYAYNPNSLLSDFVVGICEDKEGKLWVATNFGLSVFNRKTGSFENYQNDPFDENTLLDNGLNTIFHDRDGNIWVGSIAGLSMKESIPPKFERISKNLGKPDGIGAKEVICFYQDSKDQIWVGLRSGFDQYYRQTNTFKHYLFFPDGQIIPTVTSIYQDRNGIFWLGMYEGIARYDIEKGTYQIFTYSDPKDLTSRKIRDVWYMQENSKGDLYISSLLRSVFRYLPKENKFEQVSWPDINLKDIDPTLFHIDKEDNLWVGTQLDGLLKLNTQKNTHEEFKHDESNPKSISSNTILTFFEDQKGNFWVGTKSGLNLMNPKTKTFVRYMEKDGLPNDQINGIQQDNKGRLWLSTNNGLSCFDLKAKTFKNFDSDDGLQHKEFWHRSSYKLHNGEMLFGGLNGFNIVNPDKITYNSAIPPVYITGFQIFNKPVVIGAPDSPLQKSISQTKNLTLSYKESVFSFEFTALNYVMSKKNQYAYKMEGFEKEWNYVKDRRQATYTNLNPGNYVFRVKASNNDGVWNEKGTSINITITPPFWKTIWFRSLMTIIILGSAYSWYRLRINTIKKQKEVLEKQVIARTAELRDANTELIMQKEEIVAQSEHLKEANTELTKQKEEIIEQAESLREANDEINTLFSEIKDSIRAAEIIQKSILPSRNLIKNHFPESFILYKPKDIVSGDFYWFDVIEDKIIIAAADCTGHGVSGAFMSINGYHLLNQAIYPYKNHVAAEILDRLNDSLISGLHAQGENLEVQDGMDIALCIVEKDKMKLQYSGANNPLYILRDQELIQIKGNKFAIGLTIKSNELFNKFSNKEVDVQKGDTIYLFSDGYADQIGGEDGDKFMYPRFRELLMKIGNDSMEQQSEILWKVFNDWKKDMEQLDDILVIGFRV